MATSSRFIQIAFTDGVSGTQKIEAASNTSSPAAIEIKTLSSGNNTITVPSGAHAVGIFPPSGNAVTIQLKGINADTGVALAVNQWTWIAFSEASPPATFVLTAGAILNGVELDWV